MAAQHDTVCVMSSSDRVQLTFTTTREVADRLGRIAERDNRSISELIRGAVATLLGNSELPPGVRMTPEGPRYSADWLSDEEAP